MLRVRRKGIDEYRALSSDRTGSLGSWMIEGVYGGISLISSMTSSVVFVVGDSRSTRS
jgi:hypothetical protein